METADFDVRDFEERQAGDKSVMARFYTQPRRDEAESAKAGRPIYKDVEYVEIIAAGNANNIIQRPASDMDRRRFSSQYERYKAGDSEQMVGTPLVEVPWLSRSQVEELNYLKIRSLESLANLSDSVCGQYAGLYDLKRKAEAHLKAAEAVSPLTELQKENEDLKNQLAALKQAVDDQTKIISKLKDKQKE